MTAALIVAGVCLLLEMLFSGSEIAVVAADRLKLRQAASAGRRSARLLLGFLAAPQRLLATTLVGTQMAVVTSSVTMTLAMSDRYGPGRAELYTLLALTPIIVIFGEIVPKSIAQQHADRLAPRLVYVLYVAERLFLPLVFWMTRFTAWVQRRLGVEEGHKLVTREELELIVKAPPRGGEITDGERKMISRIFDFGDRTAYDVMVPLSSVVAIDEQASTEELHREVREKGYTRFPIYRERIDQIVGVLHTFDLLKAGAADLTLPAILKPPKFVAENEPLVDVLVDLQRTHQGLAVVVDEYGGAVGIVTVEDILEEIVGEIEDEHDDAASQSIRKEAEGVFRVRAQTSLGEVNRQLHLELPDGEDYETVAGLVLDRLRHIPRPGEVVKLPGLQIRVMEASARAVEEVQIRLLKRR